MALWSAHAAQSADGSGAVVTIIQGADQTRGASFSLRNRGARALWELAYLLLFRPSPRPLHAWRALLLRAFGARLGRRVRVAASARVWAPWNLTAGNHVVIGDRATVYNMEPVEIGEYSTVSQGAHLCGGSHDVDSANFQLIAAPIVLASHVWICADAFVGLGVRIAEGAVVGARSVVTRDLAQPWTIYVGHPAAPKRARSRARLAAIQDPGGG